MTTEIKKPASQAAKKTNKEQGNVAKAPIASKTKATTPKVASKAAATPKAIVKQTTPKLSEKAATKSVVKSTTITVKQIGSPLRRESKQKLYLLSLGLGKMNRIRTLPDTPSVRGLIRKAQHMVMVLS